MKVFVIVRTTYDATDVLGVASKLGNVVDIPEELLL